MVNLGDYAPIGTMIEGFLIFTMGGIGQNGQLQSDSLYEIVCAIRALHTIYAYQIL